MKKIKNKKFTSIVLSGIVVATLSLGVTIAYLVDKTFILTNSFDVGSLHTDIEEVVNGNLTKEPKVVNIDVSDALVRVRLTISNKEIFEKNFGLKGLDTDKTASNWECTDPNNKYDTMYYYKKVLKAKDNNPETTDDVTTALFTKILKNTGSEYVEFEFNSKADGTYTPKSEEDIEKLKLLNDIEITIYQESIPVHAVITNEKGEKEYVNAVDANGNIIKEKAEQLWKYYDNKK